MPTADFPFDADPRFEALSRALSAGATPASGTAPHDPGFLQAAVTVVLRARPQLEVLLIKRARSERDPWSGQMALPGGRRDPDDATLRDTAVRETLEETGLDLDAVGVQLGALDELAPRSRRVPKLSIAPFVYGAPADAHAFVASREVDAIHWVTLDELRAPDTHSSVDISFADGTQAFPCYRVADDVVWGLTYRILSQFLELYEEGPLS